MHELYEVSQGTALNGINDWKNHLHPDDRETVSRALDAAIAVEKEYAVEHRVVYPGGRYSLRGSRLHSS